MPTPPPRPLALVPRCLFLALALAGSGCGRQASPAAPAPPAAVDPAAAPAPAADVDRPLDPERAAPVDLYAALSYLASDELAGRRTGTAGIERAADFLERTLLDLGVRPVPGASSLRAPVPLVDRGAVEEATLRFGESLYRLPAQVLPLTREDVDVTAPLIYLAEEALAAPPAEVRGAIVVTEAGSEDAGADVREWLTLSRERAEALRAAGAAALVEVYRSAAVPFARLAAGVNRAGMVLDEGGGPRLPQLYVKAELQWDGLRRGAVRPGEATLRIVAPETRTLTSDNLVGVLPGTDPSLVDEYVLASAHYDHIGVTPRPGLVDSINNGARDNGMGTVALLHLAEAFARDPGRRPLLLAAWTAEEEGLLGSRYWVEHPSVPLDRVAFNLNLDGAGYTDTSTVVFNGYGFTTAQAAIDSAIAATGLAARGDPVPQYGLYRQSDNFNLAARGVPAVNMAPGFEGFTDELMRYYHQPADEAAAVSPTYLAKYAAAAAAAARAVANAEDLGWDPASETVREYVELDE